MTPEDYADLMAKLEAAEKTSREAAEQSAEVKAILDEIMTKIDVILAEVKPALDQVMESSLFRMMTGGKKKRTT